jgi:hypothetical protein
MHDCALFATLFQVERNRRQKSLKLSIDWASVRTYFRVLAAATNIRLEVEDKVCK